MARQIAAGTMNAIVMPGGSIGMVQIALRDQAVPPVPVAGGTQA
jgi:hypothetical protein